MLISLNLICRCEGQFKSDQKGLTEARHAWHQCRERIALTCTPILNVQLSAAYRHRVPRDYCERREAPSACIYFEIVNSAKTLKIGGRDFG